MNPLNSKRSQIINLVTKVILLLQNSTVHNAWPHIHCSIFVKANWALNLGSQLVLDLHTLVKDQLRAWIESLLCQVVWWGQVQGFGQFWLRGDVGVYTQGCFLGHSGLIILRGGLTLADFLLLFTHFQGLIFIPLGRYGDSISFYSILI